VEIETSNLVGRLTVAIPSPRMTNIYERSVVMSRSFVRSSLTAAVQPTLDPSAEIFMSVQFASPGRGGELVGGCCVCARCVGWRKAWVGVSSLSDISKRAPSRRGPLSGYARTAIYSAPALTALLQRLACGLNHIYLLRLSRQRGWYNDAVNQGISNGHSLWRTPSNPLTCPGLTPCSSCA